MTISSKSSQTFVVLGGWFLGLASLLVLLIFVYASRACVNKMKEQLHAHASQLELQMTSQMSALRRLSQERERLKASLQQTQDRERVVLSMQQELGRGPELPEGKTLESIIQERSRLLKLLDDTEGVLKDQQELLHQQSQRIKELQEQLLPAGKTQLPEKKEK